MVRVEVFFKDGARLESTVEAGRGNERNFASQADVVEKFDKLASHVLPQDRVERIRDWMLNLERQPDAGELAGLLAGR